MLTLLAGVFVNKNIRDCAQALNSFNVFSYELASYWQIAGWAKRIMLTAVSRSFSKLKPSQRSVEETHCISSIVIGNNRFPTYWRWSPQSLTYWINYKYHKNICARNIEGFEYPYEISQNPLKSTLNSFEKEGLFKVLYNFAWWRLITHS